MANDFDLNDEDLDLPENYFSWLDHHVRNGKAEKDKKKENTRSVADALTIWQNAIRALEDGDTEATSIT